MQTLTDLELIKTLGLQTFGEPQQGVHHTAQKYIIAGRIVSTLREGRLIREKDVLGVAESRKQRFLAQWIQVNEEHLKTSLVGRITLPEYNLWINGGHGDPNKALKGVTGRYITILMYAALRTIGTKDTVECTKLTGEEENQWRRLLINTPIARAQCREMQMFPGIIFSLTNLAIKYPTTQYCEARDIVKGITPIVFERDGITRKCEGARLLAATVEQTNLKRMAALEEELQEVARKKEENDKQRAEKESIRAQIKGEEEKFIEEERLRLIEEKETDFASLLRKSPADVRVAFSEQKSIIREHINAAKSSEEQVIQAKTDLLEAKSQIENLQDQIVDLYTKIELLNESHRADIKSLAERRISLTIPDEKGIIGENRVREHLQNALQGRCKIISVRTTPDHMDIHVMISDNHVVAVEVKMWKEPLGKEELEKFFSNVVTLSQKSEIIIVGAILISLTSRIAAHSSPDIWSQRCPKTGIKTWLVNNLESTISPVSVLTQIFSDLIDLEWTLARGIYIGMGVQRGEPADELLKLQSEDLYPKLCDVIPCCPQRYPSSYKAIESQPNLHTIEHVSIEKGAAVRGAIDEEGRVATECISSSEGVMIRTVIDTVSHQAHAELLAANGDAGKLSRDGITGSVIATSRDALTGTITENVIIGSKVISCTGGVAVPRDIPSEYHFVFNVTKPWGTGLHNIAMAIIDMYSADETSQIRLKTLRTKLFNHRSIILTDSAIRQHVNSLINTMAKSFDPNDSRQILIKGLRERS